MNNVKILKESLMMIPGMFKKAENYTFIVPLAIIPLMMLNNSPHIFITLACAFLPRLLFKKTRDEASVSSNRFIFKTFALAWLAMVILGDLLNLIFAPSLMYLLYIVLYIVVYGLSILVI